MGIRRLTAIVVLCEVCALGVFFASLLAVAAGHGGQLTLDLSRYNEGWLEYAILVGIMGTLPYALYILDVEAQQ